MNKGIQYSSLLRVESKVLSLTEEELKALCGLQSSRPFMNLRSLQEGEFTPQRRQQPVIFWVKKASHKEVAISTAQFH